MRKLFGTDGVRGTANIYPMTAEVALSLGRAIAHVSKNHHRRHRIVIGKDTRLSGYMLETALASGICSMGCDVLLVGPMPTPAIAFLTHSMRADAGVVISASHNPYQDNGIKFFDGSGFKLPDEKELQIEQLVFTKDIDSLRPTAGHIGKAFRVDDASGRYISYIKGLFPQGLTLEGMKIVLDCAHGAGYVVAPAILEELGAEVIRLGVTPNGTNINDHAGALSPEKMQETVRREKANLGIALDGDADRVVVCDEKGEVVHGDAIMALLTRHLLKEERLAKKTLVTTVMSSLALDHLVQSWGGKVIRSDVGDRYVASEMRKGGYNFGGEQSGHLIFLDYSTTGDGMLAALQLLALILEEQKPLSELTKVFTPYPQVLLNVPVRKKTEFDQVPEVFKEIQKVERELGEKGRVLLRYSGTEPVARVMVEGVKSEQIERLARDLAGCIEKNLS